jgi:hypothetical protein
MTHMDDQVAKHIKAMIRRIRQKHPEPQDESPKPDELNRVVKILRSRDYPYGLMPPTRATRRDGGSRT